LSPGATNGNEMRIAVPTLMVCVGALLTLGMVMQYSTGMWKGGAQYFKLQLLWCVLGMLACGVTAAVDYRFWKRFAVAGLLGTVVLLTLVWAPVIGICRNGAHRWLGFQSVSLFQPSELAKLTLILMVAWYAERYQRQMGTWKRGILAPMLWIGVVLALIFKEPDRGTTILLAGVSGTMLLLAGVRWRCLVPPVCVAAGALVFSLLHDSMRIKRIFGWLYLEEHKSGVGYQAYQAMIALGSGGWTGSGLGNGTQKLGFVPEHHTDFILSIIGEELGLMATLLVVLAFIVIFVCGLVIAIRAPDTFGLLLGSGITFLIGFQAFINIGVVTSVLPNKGLPLPFVSYGGSSLLMMLTCVGLLLSIARHAKPAEEMAGLGAKLFVPHNPFRAETACEGAGGD
jgi:cell division protein FtsW